MDWDTGSHEEFYAYYQRQSLKPETMERFRAACRTVLRIYGPLPADAQLDVLDIGCGAGAQSVFWYDGGHRYRGVDINEPLVMLARRRASELGLDVRFDLGTATALPCDDAVADICMLPELLEHVVDWQSCLDEAVRVLRPGGLLYLSTSNRLCPKQQEFNLPLYSWYPGRLKRHFEQLALTDRPDLANYAKYPAVHWFSFYGLRAYLEPKGCTCLDRFDLIDTTGKSALARGVVAALRTLPPLRFIGHVMTPYTIVVARKTGTSNAH
jgi:2-polyprenyl-6-hydroxyphenyl methylase/3-demethylubiquinone-9 3-methyltransferase